MGFLLKKNYHNESITNKDDILRWFESLFNSAWSLKSDTSSGINLGDITPLYGKKTANMESFCRLLWGVFPTISGNNKHNLKVSEIFICISEGTDPEHVNYWGDLSDFDQRSVEMAALACGLALADEHFKKHLTQRQIDNLIKWLNKIRDVEIPKNNWSFFPIIVEMALCLTGREYSKKTIELHFEILDSYYLGDGWYSDGISRPRDYYNAMALHYYGLFYSKMMVQYDPERCQILRERASVFAKDFIHMFGSDGSAIPFGRSMTYRFAQVAFWSAAIFAEIDSIPMSVIKGLFLRNLRWWREQQILDSRGILTVGYSYSNLILAEDYNAPGSSYWCCKIFLILALPDEHLFWHCSEDPLPTQVEGVHCITHSGQIVHHDLINNHHYLLNAGQFPAKNYNNSESKYCKFSYSSLLGFNLERSRYSLELNSCDSSLLLSEGDGYYRGRRTSLKTKINQDGVYTEWYPWPDVNIKTWLIPLTSGYARVHIINTKRALECVDGGFPVPVPDFSQSRFNEINGCVICQEENLFSSIVDISPEQNRKTEMVISPPGSNIIYPCSSGVPVLRNNISPGKHVLMSMVNAGLGSLDSNKENPNIFIEESVICIKSTDKTYVFSF